jgi:hypothetical protein
MPISDCTYLLFIIETKMEVEENLVGVRNERKKSAPNVSNLEERKRNRTQWVWKET